MPPPAGDRLVLLAVSAGGALGALARHAVVTAWPARPGGFDWAVLAVNASGCLLIGVLMTLVTERRLHSLLRPFLGVGVLGGYTTFSAYAVVAVERLSTGAAAVGLLYLAATLVAALAATHTGRVLTLALLGPVGRPG